jgi:hypothetical protein
MTITKRLVKIEKALGSNLGREMDYPGWGVSDFSLSLQTNSETVPQLSRYRFLPNSFQFISYRAILRYIVSILKASLNNTPYTHTYSFQI